MDYYFVNPHPSNYPNYAHSTDNSMTPSSSELILSDYLILDDCIDHHQESGSQSTESSERVTFSGTRYEFDGATSKNNNMQEKCKNGIKRNNKTEQVRSRIAFRTKSELEIMDDGYKWRKYGKKSVKSSPNLSREAQQIVSLPISFRLPQDQLIWHWEKHGNYSVRSAYHLLCEERANKQPGPSKSADRNLWKEIWRVRLPTKVRNFLWRVAKNVVPTRYNLCKKGIKVDMLCPLCHLAVEKTDHIFMQCHMTKLVWFSSHLGIHVPEQIELNQWMLSWLTCTDLYATQLFCAILWKIWNARNRVVFQNDIFDPICIATNAADMVQEVNKENPQKSTQQTVQAQLGWSPPADGWTKINVDAGCFKEGCTGWGMVARNHLGEVLFAACKKEDLMVEPTLAEALGVRWSMQVAREQNCNRVIFETDAEMVVNCIYRKSHIAALDPVIIDCRVLLSEFQDCVICRVKRQRNVAAHCLVKVAQDYGSRFWLGNGPSQIQNALCMDRIYSN